MKTCVKCKETKLLNLFSTNANNKDKKNSWCKSCHRDWRSKNKERLTKQKRIRSLKNKYGVDESMYLRMVASQSNLCKICNKSGGDNNHGVLYVDHSHTTNEVRGLLCLSCNALLGHAKDNIYTLTKAIEYLRSFNEQETEFKVNEHETSFQAFQLPMGV